jgi:hypothetical protein
LNYQNVVSAQLDEATAKKLEAYCVRKGLYTAGVVRDSVVEHLDRLLKEEQMDTLNELQSALEKLSGISENTQVLELVVETRKVLGSLSPSAPVQAPPQ